MFALKILLLILLVFPLIGLAFFFMRLLAGEYSRKEKEARRAEMARVREQARRQVENVNMSAYDAPRHGRH